MPQKLYDAKEIKNTISVLCDPDNVFEIRGIGTARKTIVSGYFKDADTLLQQIDKIDLGNRIMYITLGEVKSECFARSQSERFLQTNQTTSDTEIVRYKWLFIDFDPVRTAGISSTDQELQFAKELSKDVQRFLSGLQFAEPVIAHSGNGYHLLYRINIPNDESGRALIEKCLKALSAMFDTDKVKIDTTNYNPSRICKLYGTWARKGANTTDRPHRLSRIISVPDEVNETQRSALEFLAGQIKEEPKKQKNDRKSVQEPFDLVDFLQRNSMTYKLDMNDRATIYRLDECPFDHNHRDGDAKIFQYDNGAIAFKCHHNSCSRYRWQDVREKYEPSAYEQIFDEERGANIDAGWAAHLRKKAEKAKNEKPKKKKRSLKTAKGLLAKDIPEPEVFVGVGDENPLLVEGTCILSAKPKLGKSWFVLSMLLAISNGDDFLGRKTKKCSTLYLDLETSEAIQKKRLLKALKGKPVPDNFYLDTETDSLADGFIDQIEFYREEDPDLKVIVIDVFQIIRTDAKNRQESDYSHAYRDLTPLNQYAQDNHISIILVTHDRKAVDPDDPFSNILGSTGLQGAATQMIVMFRKKKDDPIHISIKGKTIDGLPEINVNFEDATWTVISGTSADSEQAKEEKEYFESNIRAAVLKIAENENGWRGKCKEIKEKAVNYDIPILESYIQIGTFMGKQIGRFLAVDKVKISIIKNGTGGKEYEIRKSIVDIVDENGGLIVDNFQKADEYGIDEIPFV